MNGSYLQGGKEAYLQNFQDRLMDKPTKVLERYRKVNGPHGWFDLIRFLYSERNWKDVAIMRELSRREEISRR